MKVAVYTIALNESHFVERWYESAKDADYLLIADTGSTDDTAKLAKKLGINVITVLIKPWRFDMARNASIAALPSDIDYCIALDMDEVLLPNWRKELKKAYKLGVTRPRYQYTWSWKEDGTPGLQYGGDKIHSRFGYKWKHPVHEVISAYGDTRETQSWVGLEIHHHPDHSKPRSQYLPLLKQAVQEDLNDDRNAFYYARELYFYNQKEQAIQEFKRHLALPTAKWTPERAASMRYLAKIEHQNKEDWLLKAVAEAPGRREALVELSRHYYETSDWEKCYNYAIQAISIKEKPLDYLCEDFAWAELPWDLAAYSAFRLNKPEEAVKYNNEAMSLNSKDERLKNNSFYYQEAVKNKN
jgi:glycosyltransferase involved in cell wall biosynthesis